MAGGGFRVTDRPFCASPTTLAKIVTITTTVSPRDSKFPRPRSRCKPTPCVKREHCARGGAKDCLFGHRARGWVAKHGRASHSLALPGTATRIAVSPYQRADTWPIPEDRRAGEGCKFGEPAQPASARNTRKVSWCSRVARAGPGVASFAYASGAGCGRVRRHRLASAIGRHHQFTPPSPLSGQPHPARPTTHYKRKQK